MRRIKKDDQIIVNCGKDKGRRGSVLEVRGDRVLVEGLNIAKKHVRPDPNRGIGGGIQEKEMFLHISNVNIYNPETGKGDRVGFKFLEQGGVRRKVRYYRSSGEVIDL